MSALSVSCPSCHAVLKLPENIPPGAKPRCPKCRTSMTLSVSPPPANTHSAIEGEGSRHEQTEAHSAERVDESSYLEGPKAANELGWLGPYRILRKLGEGGMGMVYEAEDTKLRRKVALKVMLPKHAANPTAKARFLREARAQAAVEHENVAAIFVVGDDQAVPYIAMPLLKGQTLQAALNSNPKPPVAEILRVGQEMAEGLAAAHAIGLIHRDIKPANVWLEGNKRKVKILDFGLARAMAGADVDVDESEGPKTQQGAMLGTPAYMSPEQGRGAELDARSDLFSLGVVLYEMATGERPFKGKDIWGLLTSLAVDHPAAPSQKNPAIPETLSAFILKMLAKSPAERPQSGEEIVETLKQIEESTKILPVAYLPAATPAVDDPWANIDATDTGDSRRSASANPVTASGAVAADPPRSSKKPLLIGLGGLLAAIVLGVVIIKITNKDGSVTEIKVPDGAKVEVVQGGKAKVVVAPPMKEPPAIVEAPKTPSLPETATLAEREAWAKQQQADWAAKLKLPVESTSPTGLAMVVIPPGEGVEKPFLMGKHEVTQGEWEKVMGYNPSEFGPKNMKVAGMDTTRFPVEMVNWFECIEFCNKLSEKEGLKPYYELMVTKRGGTDNKQIEDAEVKIQGGSGYHIPTYPEWTWACLAGARTKFHFGESEKDLHEYAWLNNNSRGWSHAGGEKKPNAFGLYDTHWNVREWNEEMLTKADTGAPERVHRGGHWLATAPLCAVNKSLRTSPTTRVNHQGFRLSRVPVAEMNVPDPDASGAKQLQTEWAAKLKQPVESTSPTGIAMVVIPPGEGVAKPFLMGKYEATQGEFEKVMGYNPSVFIPSKVAGMDTSKFPVEQVSWFDCVEFCNKLSEKEGFKPYYELTVTKRQGPSIEQAEAKILGGNGYHLPTAAEWTWACAAGAKTKYHFGNRDEDLAEYAWFDQNSAGRSHTVGEKKPNAFGLYDIHGNVREWNEDVLTKAETGAPERASRGGQANLTPGFCAVISRLRNAPASRHYSTGFRIARVP